MQENAMVKIRFVIDRVTLDGFSLTSTDVARFAATLSGAMRLQLLHEAARTRRPVARAQAADAMRIGVALPAHGHSSPDRLGRTLGEALVRSAWGANEDGGAGSGRLTQQVASPSSARRT